MSDNDNDNDEYIVHLSVMFIVALVGILVLCRPRPISPLRFLAIFWQIGYVVSEPSLLIFGNIGEGGTGYAVAAAISAGALACIGAFACGLTWGCYQVGWRGNREFDSSGGLRKGVCMIAGVIISIFVAFSFLSDDEDKKLSIGISLAVYLVGRVPLSMFWIVYFLSIQFGQSSKGWTTLKDNIAYASAAAGSFMFLCSLASGLMWLGWIMLGVVTWAVITLDERETDWNEIFPAVRS